MKHALTIFICLLIAGVACKKPKPVVTYPANELHYKETGCSDPWRVPKATDAELAENVKDWLLLQNITVLEIKITTGHEEIQCKACTCPTGRRIQALFAPSDTAKAKSFGFYKP